MVGSRAIVRLSVAGVGLFAAAVAAVATFACRQVVGIGDDAGSVSACGMGYGTQTCASCIQAHCCAESTACAADGQCGGHYGCLARCATADWECRAQCVLDSSPGTSAEYAPLTACMYTKCESECGLPCGGAGTVGVPPDAASACHSCLSTHVCADEKACASSPECSTWVQCTQSCSTPDCRFACSLAHRADAGLLSSGLLPDDSGVAWSGRVPAPYESIVNAYALTCAAACAAGANWSCVGHVAWPTPLIQPATLTADVLDFITDQPVEGVDASVCRQSDPGCTGPLMTGQTDVTGYVQLPLPSERGIASLGTDVFVQFTSPSIVPTLSYLGYPVTEPQASVGEPYVLVATPDEVTMAFGEPVDTTRGAVQFVVADCDFVAAAGARVSIDSKDTLIRPFYYQSGAASFTATTTDNVGASAGSGGFLHVPPGEVTLTATPHGLPKPSSTAHVLVRSGAITIVFMYPTPQ